VRVVLPAPIFPEIATCINSIKFLFVENSKNGDYLEIKSLLLIEFWAIKLKYFVFVAFNSLKSIFAT